MQIFYRFLFACLLGLVAIRTLADSPQPTCVFRNSLISGQDPSIAYKDGMYYLVQSNGGVLTEYGSPTLSNIANGTSVSVYYKANDPVYNGDMWAPSSTGGRALFIQPLTWRENGIPIFGDPIPSGISQELPSGEFCGAIASSDFADASNYTVVSGAPQVETLDSQVISTNTIETDIWLDIVVMRDIQNNIPQLFVDGMLQGKILAGNDRPISRDFIIGSGVTDEERATFLQGTIVHVQLFNGAFKPEQLTQLFP
jgi:hypothetical protein